MNRRQFVSLLSIAPFASSALYAQQDVLQKAFESLTEAARKSAQSQLAMAGFYSGQIDGAYGAATRSALTNAAQFIFENSYQKVSFDLSTPEGAQTYLDALSRQELDKYLWGEGDESAEG